MRAVALCVLLVVLVACGGKTASFEAPLGCGDRPTVGGVCVGVPDAPICAGERCVEGCRSVLPIDDDAQLQRQGTVAGDCLALAPGSYGDVQLGAGVALLGRGHRDVLVRSIVARGDAFIRGVSATSIRSIGVGLLRLDRVMVDGGDGAGVQVVDGELEVRQSTIRRGSGPGLTLTCKTSCPLGARQRLSVHTTWIDRQRLIGVWASRADVELGHVVVTGMLPHAFLFGRGVELTERSTLRASFVRVERATDVAFFLHASTGTLSNLEVLGGSRAVHLSAIPDGGVVLDRFRFDGVSAVGVGIDRASRGVVLRNGSIVRTRLLRVPVDIGGQVDVGDGISWTGGSEATIERTVTIAESGRRAAVIHPSALGAFEATLLGDDARRGIVVRAGSAAEHPGLAIAKEIFVNYSTAPIPIPPASTPP